MKLSVVVSYNLDSTNIILDIHQILRILLIKLVHNFYFQKSHLLFASQTQNRSAVAVFCTWQNFDYKSHFHENSILDILLFTKSFFTWADNFLDCLITIGWGTKAQCFCPHN